MLRVGIDIGGTFTDLVAADADGITVHKVPSTPADPSEAFRSVLARVGEAPDELRHGTTVATNAVITRSGARIGFVGTNGFRHLLHLARQDRPSLYDLRAHRAEPVVERDLCVGVPERIGPGGEVVEELDTAGTRAALEQLRGRVEGVAVTLLHSYANPTHERALAAIVREVLGVEASISSDVLGEFREYERASTTALNAYIRPVMERYMRAISSASPTRVGVMWSGGGVRGIERTVDRPVHTLLSGPAAGVLGALWAARSCGVRDVITLDMGGTSADVAVADGGAALFAEESSLDGLPFRTPCIDVISVGAGGGSIAWVDDGGALRVGPRSAGADPGPACYGRGGRDATVTDAQVVLGLLGDDLAGGEVVVHREAARAAVERVGVAVGVEPSVAADGILRVVRATMARAIRSVSVERGKDVRRYALAAFGGAGPLHAVALARDLGIGIVVVPPAPGALAALGLLVAARRCDASISRPMRADRSLDAELRTILAELTEQVLGELADEGVARAEASVALAVDCRYAGQSHELRIPVEGGPSFVLVAEAFHRSHAERYGFAREDVAVEAVTFRAAASGPPGEVSIRPRPAAGGAAPVSERLVGGVTVPVFDRSTLATDAVVDGPAIIAELDSTTWLPKGSRARAHAAGALVVEVAT